MKVEDKAYVYYTPAQDVTQDQNSLIRGYTPLGSDQKVYIMSYENFLRRALVNLHLVCPHAAWLYSVDVSALLDVGETEKNAKSLGSQFSITIKVRKEILRLEEQL